MSLRQANPSPLAGEGGLRRRRRTGEGAPQGKRPDASGGGVEQYPSPVVSLTRAATLSRKGRGKENRALRPQQANLSLFTERGKRGVSR
jgi:hypothetical protein